MTPKESSFNKYIDTFINNYVKSFRSFNKSHYLVTINGIADFIAVGNHDILVLINKLQLFGFDVTISKGRNTIDEIQVDYAIEGNIQNEHFEYRIENLISLIYLSSKTDISIVGIIIMQIISRIICKYKIIYKAIILDLDDTIWKGNLSEDGINLIIQNLHSYDGVRFVAFMQFIKTMAKELGLYVAICSRNDDRAVISAINQLNEKDFPLKGHIDCVIANDNDKSKNIKAIAQQLSILTNACVLIDDNQLVRDEVRQHLPEVFVPDWDTHDELITLIITCCIFNRFELSLKYRNRKQLHRILNQERERNYLPKLFVKSIKDTHNTEAIRLYAKSNQFKFSDKKILDKECKSIVFEIYRDNGENLGVCSALTYKETKQNIHILNWAISCRYFEIGLEEYILLYLINLAKSRTITFTFNDSGFNAKAVAIIEKYKSCFSRNIDENVYFIANVQSIHNICLNTNLKEYYND